AMLYVKHVKTVLEKRIMVTIDFPVIDESKGRADWWRLYYEASIPATIWNHFDCVALYEADLFVEIKAEDYNSYDPPICSKRIRIKYQDQPRCFVRHDTFLFLEDGVVHRRGDCLYFGGWSRSRHDLIYHKLDLTNEQVRFELCKMKVLGSFPVLLQHLL
ncbi:hypothetical protein LCGC14_2986850, partial [marine sediment metagenome]